jgi:tryptophan synthase beta chain
VPETLSFALDELSAAYDAARARSSVPRAPRQPAHSTTWAERTPLYFAERLTKHAGGAAIFLKREDLNHTGAHKINNAIGQALLAQRLGKQRIIAETGAGPARRRHGHRLRLLGLPCRVFMGAIDVARQRPNVQRMELLGRAR